MKNRMPEATVPEEVLLKQARCSEQKEQSGMLPMNQVAGKLKNYFWTCL